MDVKKRKYFSPREIFRAAILIVAAAGILLTTRHFGLYEYLTPQRIRDFVLAFGIWSPIIFICVYVTRTFFFFPASILSISAGLAFGPFWGTCYTVVGATLSSSLTFVLVRWFGRGLVDSICKRCGPVIEGLDEKIGDRGFWVILFLRLVPIFSYEGINVAAGLSKIAFWRYFWGTLLGIIPGSFAFNYLGGSLLNIRDPKLLLAILVVLVSISIPTLYRILRRRKR